MHLHVFKHFNTIIINF